MRAQGLDLSKYQYGYDPTVKEHDFVYIKATESDWEDIRFKQHAEEIAPVEVRGAYHYFRSVNISDPNFWKRQADKFLKVVDPHDFDFFVLDFERRNNQPSMRFGAGARAWLDYVHGAKGKRILLYSNPATYQEYLLQYGQRWMNEYDYICAQYPFNGWDERLQAVYTGSWLPRLPAGQLKWKIWQFSADGNRKGPENGIKRMPWHVVPPAVDLNVFNGTAQELRRWAGTASPENPEPGICCNSKLDLAIECIQKLKE